MPPTSGMAFVIILHLSPKHESNLDKVLQAVTEMPVLQVSEAVEIRKDHIYVISPAKHLSMVHGSLQVSTPPAQRDRHTSIDLFFRTLGETQKARAMCIVLSGTGSDGTVGSKSIKEEGGVTIAQAPDDAEYDVDAAQRHRKRHGRLRAAGRRNAAEADGAVSERATDRAARMPSELRQRATTRRGAPRRRCVRCCQILRARTGHDFAHYKRATVLRRIERRMQVNQLRDLPAYRDFLRDHPDGDRPLLRTC